MLKVLTAAANNITTQWQVLEKCAIQHPPNFSTMKHLNGQTIVPRGNENTQFMEPQHYIFVDTVWIFYVPFFVVLLFREKKVS